MGAACLVAARLRGPGQVLDGYGYSRELPVDQIQRLVISGALAH